MFRLLPLPEVDWSPQLFFFGFAGLYAVMRRNQLLETLPESRETAFNVMMNPVIVLNDAGNLVDINPSGIKNWPHIASCIGKPLKASFPELSNNLQAGEANVEIALSSNGNPRWYSVSCSGITSEAGENRGLLYLFNDVTLNRQARESLAVSAKQQEETNAAKDTFFSIIVHDLRNPFTIISGLTELVAEAWRTMEPDKLDERLHLIQQSASKAHTLLENLLQWAQLQSGGIKPQSELVILKKVIQDAVSLSEIHAGAKQITLTIFSNDDPLVLGDSNMLATVFRNVISNAVKFSHPESTVEIILTEENGFAVVVVKDTGVGMRKEALAGLFEIGVRSSATGTAKETGTGLGLILCRDFLKLNRGTIALESEAGRGTAVTIKLPLV
jgi:signal transduction histidine kinase